MDEDLTYLSVEKFEKSGCCEAREVEMEAAEVGGMGVRDEVCLSPGDDVTGLLLLEKYR